MNSYKQILGTLALTVLISLLVACTTPKPRPMEHIASVSSTDGSTITYGVKGQGDTTIVFVHCWTCNHEFWRSQIETFSQDHQVIWLDLAGHGLSRSNRDNYTMQAFGQDIAAVVNKVSAERVVLVGHSMGGPVSVEAAELLGDKVVGIVGVDTFYTPFQYPQTEEGIAAMAKPFEENFRASAEGMVRSMFTPQANPELIQSIINQMAITDEVLGISALYELLRWKADRGPALLEKHNAKLHNINGAPSGKEQPLHESVVMINGVGHFPAQVKPAGFNEVLNGMIKDTE